MSMTGALTDHFITANGDSLFAESSELGAPKETPGVNKIVTRNS